MKLSAISCGIAFICASAAIHLFTPLNSFSQQAWTRVPSPDTSATRNLLRGISGISSSDVWAVGHFESPPAGNLRNLVMHWNGAGWELSHGTDLSGTYNDLWDVAAITTNDAWAVGTYNEPGTSRAQLLHWNGSSWTHTVLPAIQGGSFLFSIDAIASNDIWAVGGQAGSPTRPGYTIHYNGSTWTEFPAASPGIFRNYFNAVDGIVYNDVWAVGFLSNNIGDFHAMAQHWDGSSWTNIPLPSSISSPLGELFSVTMVSSNDVWAVGSTVTGNILMIHWDGANWSEVSTAGSSGGAIVARGTDVFSVGDRISEWSGSSWTVIDSLTQLSYPSLVSAVTFSNGDIWTSGRTFDTAFHTLVYRTANAIPHFVHGNTQVLSLVINSAPHNMDEMLKVEDPDLSQVVIYELITTASHGTLNGLADTAITINGFAKPSGVTYTPAPGYVGTDQFTVKASVGPLTSQLTTLVNVGPGPLPVLISDYVVRKTGSVTTMQWNTVTEINLREFVMERSVDGINFTALNQIAAQGGGYQYKLIDPFPVAGWNYYRLKEVDIDGGITFFPVKSLRFDSEELKEFMIFPNPVVGRTVNLLLNAGGDCVLSIHDLQGQEIIRKMIIGSSPTIQVTLPSTIPAGVYMLTLVKQQKLYAEKIFIR